MITNFTFVKVMTLTNEGGRLKRDKMLARGRDFELVPESVWKCLSSWYGGSPALPRTVISPLHGDASPELELYPISVKLFRHQNPQQRPQQVTSFTGMIGGMGGMAVCEFIFALILVFLCDFSEPYCGKDIFYCKYIKS